MFAGVYSRPLRTLDSMVAYYNIMPAEVSPMKKVEISLIKDYFSCLNKLSQIL